MPHLCQRGRNVTIWSISCSTGSCASLSPWPQSWKGPGLPVLVPTGLTVASKPPSCTGTCLSWLECWLTSSTPCGNGLSSQSFSGNRWRMRPWPSPSTAGRNREGHTQSSSLFYYDCLFISTNRLLKVFFFFWAISAQWHSSFCVLLFICLLINKL